MSRVRKKKIGSQSTLSSNKKQRTIDLGLKYRDDEHIDSDEDGDDYDEEQQQRRQRRSFHSNSDDDESVEEEETLDAKKVRLARQYLEKIEAGDSDDDSSSAEGGSDDDDDDDDDDENDHDRIGLKLQRERMKQEGTLEHTVANKVKSHLERIQDSLPKPLATTTEQQEAKDWITSGHVKLLRGHDLTPTCVALQTSGTLAISGSKDHSVLLWDVEQEKRSLTLCPTWKRKPENDADTLSRTKGEVLSVACSDDNRYAAVGRRDSTVSIFDIRAGKNSLVQTFTGHKGAVTCLGFRTQSLQLFSGSEDRCIRHYNLNEMMYLETLYGHQFGITGIDCHRKERPISVGRDRTARAWKLAEDTHLIFRGGAKVSSADCVSVIKDDWFLTGHEDGHLGLWMTEKKKSVVNLEAVHGRVGDVGRGISSLASLKGSDLAITGSFDGYLRLWKAMTGPTNDTRSLESIGQVPLSGYVNGIAIGPKARFCVVAVGQEPRLGRWNRIAKAKNRFGIVRLKGDEEEVGEESESDAVDDEALSEQSDDGSGDSSE